MAEEPGHAQEAHRKGNLLMQLFKIFAELGAFYFRRTQRFLFLPNSAVFIFAELDSFYFRRTRHFLFPPNSAVFISAKLGTFYFCRTRHFLFSPNSALFIFAELSTFYFRRTRPFSFLPSSALFHFLPRALLGRSVPEIADFTIINVINIFSWPKLSSCVTRSHWMQVSFIWP